METERFVLRRLLCVTEAIPSNVLKSIPADLSVTRCLPAWLMSVNPAIRATQENNA
jgi:hypothetical protein